jgi:arginine decarboxylase-like protein
MTGREKKEYNDLFFVCSLIEYIGRKTKNHRNVVVNAIGKAKLQHLYDLADVYHSDNIDKISDELTERYNIETSVFDNVAAGEYAIPTHWDIGKVYKRLIIDVSREQNKEFIDALIDVYNSWLSRKLEDYNSSLYYESPGYLYASYAKGEVL